MMIMLSYSYTKVGRDAVEILVLIFFLNVSPLKINNSIYYDTIELVIYSGNYFFKYRNR